MNFAEHLLHFLPTQAYAYRYCTSPWNIDDTIQIVPFGRPVYTLQLCYNVDPPCLVLIYVPMSNIPLLTEFILRGLHEAPIYRKK